MVKSDSEETSMNASELGTVFGQQTGRVRAILVDLLAESLLHIRQQSRFVIPKENYEENRFNLAASQGEDIDGGTLYQIAQPPWSKSVAFLHAFGFLHVWYQT
jgi:hypothetical protein